VVKSWPESDGTDNSIHAETTTKLIRSIEKVVDAIKLVEEKVNPNLGDDGNGGSGGGGMSVGNVPSATGATGNASEKEQQNRQQLQQQEDNMALGHKLRQTAVPLDLLDMMDADPDAGLNPDCFARGLLNEALRQFSNLNERKASMNMLASFVENAFERRERELRAAAAAAAASEAEEKKKSIKQENNDEADEGILLKKRKRQADDTNVKVEPPTKR